MNKARLKRYLFKAANGIASSRLTDKFRKGPLLLVYHGVEERLVNDRVQTVQIPLAIFERQMAYLRKHRQVISLDDLHSCLSSGHPLDAAHVLITFDDGYKNNRSVAAPLLESLGFPFAVFVATRHLEERLRFPIYRLKAALHYAERKHLSLRRLETAFDLATESQKRQASVWLSRLMKTSARAVVESIVQDVSGLISKDRWLEIDHLFSSEEPLDWEDVKYLSRRGVIIGSHCHDHFILHAAQPADEIDRQLRISKGLIERHVGRCSYVAYPNGAKSDITPEALRMVRDNRYLLGLTSVKGEVLCGLDALLVPRIFVPEDFSQFKFRVDNAFLYNRSYARWARGFRAAGLN
jgi:peptidoglycan/xylan/chitin deacetylase (PgdA/CDA1 family)